MGQDARLFLLADERKAAEALRLLADSRCTSERRGQWLAVSPADEELAQELSAQLGGTCVYWEISTAVDGIWLTCFTAGKVVRKLAYTSDDGWTTRRGRPRPFEDAAAVRALLARRDLVASHDGYALLDAFLGAEPPPDEPIVEPGATTRFELAPALVRELRASAERRGVDASVVLHAAWELAKHALLEREAAKRAPSRDVSLGEARVPMPLGARARELPPLVVAGFPLPCRLRLPPAMTAELTELKLALDKSAAWLLTEAWRLARDRVA